MKCRLFLICIMALVLNSTAYCWGPGPTEQVGSFVFYNNGRNPVTVSVSLCGYPDYTDQLLIAETDGKEFSIIDGNKFEFSSSHNAGKLIKIYSEPPYNYNFKLEPLLRLKLDIRDNDKTTQCIVEVWFDRETYTSAIKYVKGSARVLGVHSNLYYFEHYENNSTEQVEVKHSTYPYITLNFNYIKPEETLITYSRHSLVN